MALALLWLCSAGALEPGPASASAPGQLYAFGLNEFGQLGNTSGYLTGAANPLPAPVALPGQNGPVTQIAAGNSHSLVVTSTGQLYAFGEDQFGQLGVAPGGGFVKADATPTLVSLPSGSPPVTEVAAGAYFSLAVTSTGQLYGFGENEEGQLGNATNNHTTAANPTPTLVSLPGASGPVTEVAAGAYFSLAVTSTGQLFAFGANDRGQLGTATNNGSNTPNPTPTLVDLPSGSGAVVQIAAGYRYALVLTSSGQLFGFGENQYGQLGSTVDNGSSAPNPTPELVSLPAGSGPIAQIAAGADHSLAVTAGGQLFAFGENKYGQLGSTVNNGGYTPNPVPTSVGLPGAIGPVIRVAAATSSSLAITSSGQLYGFGENRYGQLGDTSGSGLFEGADPTPTLADVPPGTTIGAVGSGPVADHALAVVSDLAVTSGSLPGAQLGVPYNATAGASGGTAPYRWTAGGLPAGLAIDAATGQITGTPTVAGTAAVTLTATDAKGTAATTTLPLAILGGPGSPPPGGSKVPPRAGLAALRASLLSQLAPKGKGTSIPTLLKRRGYVLTFKALAAGRLSIHWYDPPAGAHGGKRARVLVAAGQIGFAQQGTRRLTIKLTASGKRLLAHARRFRLTAVGTFQPPGDNSITVTTGFTLRK
ncbi:MAG TPA: putative Ig domain-containing protein [Solirubrobacterales bacterium]